MAVAALLSDLEESSKAIQNEQVLASRRTEVLDITQHELKALRTKYNLADAHTHQKQSRTQRTIVERLPELWYDAERRTQHDLERAFIHSFFRLHKQPTALKKSDRIYFVYAASIAMSITAIYLKQRQATVALIEPCFDNLHDLMKHMQVPMVPIAEESFVNPDAIYDNLSVSARDADAVFLVDPNNPTGFTLLKGGKKGYQEVVRYCKDHQKLLILDLSFVSFALMDEELGRFDLYELLEDFGVSYIAMEDVGKTWPLQDAKCALIVTSDDINKAIYDIHTSVLLNVSPFILNIVREYIDDSMQDGFASVRNLLNYNRHIARQTLKDSLLEYCEPVAKTSVAWFRIRDPYIKSTDLHREILALGVYTLPGRYFYWKHPENGERFLRIALARDIGLFEPSMKIIRRFLDGYRQWD